MRAKEEGGLATYYVFLVGGESVCGEEWRRERVRAPHLTHCNAHTHRDGGRLACLRARQCVHALPYLLRAVTMVHSNPTNYLTVRLVVMMRNKNGLEPLNWS